jgi:chemotaxis protein histidine kinase CheA
MVVRVDGQAFALPFECIELAGPYEPETREGRGAEATVRVREHRARLIDAREVLGLSSRPRASCPKLLLVTRTADAWPSRSTRSTGRRS